MRGGRRFVRPLVAIAVLCVAWWIPPSSGVARGACTAPYPPVASWQFGPLQYSGFDPNITGTSLSVDLSFDTDGDGKTDQVDIRDRGSLPDGVRVTRGDGHLDLVDQTSALDASGDTYSPWSLIGDLDGDGRDEVYVQRTYPDGSTGMLVVPGATSPGVHDIDDVGIALPTGSDASGAWSYPWSIERSVPDQLDGPGDDLELWNPADNTYGIASGDAIMAVGAPVTVTDLPIIRPLPAPVVGAAQLGRDRATLLLAGNDLILRLLDGDQTTRTFSPASISPAAPESVRVVDTGSDRFIIAATDDRGRGYVGDVWNIDHPCRRIAPPGDDATVTSVPRSAPDDAPPADPLDADPSFTG